MTIVLAEINPHGFETAIDVFASSVNRFGPLTAYSSIGHEMTFDDLDKH